MLSRNIRIEEDLVDQLFNSSEKRLARTLLLLARYGMEDKPQGVLPKLSQEMLAEMIGTTRSRVNFFMNKFRKLGFIEYNGGLKINTPSSASSCTTNAWTVPFCTPPEGRFPVSLLFRRESTRSHQGTST